MDYIFIDCKEKNKIIGLVENDRLVEIYVDGDIVSDISYIYRGRVQSVVKGMNAAFIDIGHENNAYLRFKDIKTNNDTLIQELIEGREIIVQVKKDGTKTKGSLVTSKIEISGTNMVLTPYSNKVFISRSIVKKEDKIRLKNFAKEHMINDYGLIIRTNAQFEKLDDLKQEYKKLVDKFEMIEREKNFLPCPKLLYKPMLDWENLIIRRIDGIDNVIINDKAEYERVREIIKDEKGLYENKVIFKDYDYRYDDSVYPYFNQALKRKVYLKSGGSIIIDELEALTAIDVNTEGIKSDKSFRKNILKTNLEAAENIAQEIRLRNLSGIILIDFINMDSDDDRETVKKSMIEHLGSDYIKSKVYNFTALGLLEISRTKKRNSLKDCIVQRS